MFENILIVNLLKSKIDTDYSSRIVTVMVFFFSVTYISVANTDYSIKILRSFTFFWSYLSFAILMLAGIVH